MLKTIRMAIAVLIAAAGITQTGCHEASTPARGIELQVSPDIVRIDPGNRLVVIRYAVKNTADVDLILVSRPDVQSEQAPGAWATVVDSLGMYIQPSLGGTVVSRGGTVELVSAHYLGAGRFRLRAPYWQNDPTGVTVPGSSHEAVSNAFTVAP
jgi:hypothetical protein